LGLPTKLLDAGRNGCSAEKLGRAANAVGGNAGKVPVKRSSRVSWQ